jgi:hypothetical protein
MVMQDLEQSIRERAYHLWMEGGARMDRRMLTGYLLSEKSWALSSLLSAPFRLMSTNSRDRLTGSSVRAAAERAAAARKKADKLACEAWTKPMLAFNGSTQPSPTVCR